MPSSNPEHTDELSVIGYSELVDLLSVVDGGYIYLHRGCADWSAPLENLSQTNESGEKIKLEDCGENDENIKTVVIFSLQRKCSFCLRYGASVTCRVSTIKLSLTKYFISLLGVYS